MVSHCIDHLKNGHKTPVAYLLYSNLYVRFQSISRSSIHAYIEQYIFSQTLQISDNLIAGSSSSSQSLIKNKPMAGQLLACHRL